MTTDFEKALAGEHGGEARRLAEDAVQSAILKVGEMFSAAGPTFGGEPKAFIGGVVSPSVLQPRLNDGEYVVPLGKLLQERVTAKGYTDLRFNSETMLWACHKPDQAIGDDGRIYVKVGRHDPD